MQQPLTKTPQSLTPATPHSLLASLPVSLPRTKLTCTLGPTTSTPSQSSLLLSAGMNIVRLNFSHGDHQKHRTMLQGVREGAGGVVAVMLDTKGPEIRTGECEGGVVVEVQQGQQLEITTDYTHQGNRQRIACSYPQLPSAVSVGSRILIADGAISTVVTAIEDRIVTVQVLNSGTIGNRKNMCLPGSVIGLPTIGEGDWHDILNFGLKHKVNFIAVSFARYGKDILQLRKRMIEADPQHGPYVQIISKIENHEGVHNIDQIISASDGIMIARGDLGMEVPIEKVVVIQKYLTQRAINAGKLVITATQMIESMQTKPRPTRAQVADITNAVLDLTDATMTSGETTNGLFPVQTVTTMSNIIREAEAVCDYASLFQARKHRLAYPDVIALVSMSFALSTHFIFITTDCLPLVRRIASCRPKAYVVVFSDEWGVRGALAGDFGVYGWARGQAVGDWMAANAGRFGVGERVRGLEVQEQGGSIVGVRVVQRAPSQ